MVSFERLASTIKMRYWYEVRSRSSKHVRLTKSWGLYVLYFWARIFYTIKTNEQYKRRSLKTRSNKIMITATQNNGGGMCRAITLFWAEREGGTWKQCSITGPNTTWLHWGGMTSDYVRANWRLITFGRNVIRTHLFGGMTSDYIGAECYSILLGRSADWLHWGEASLRTTSSNCYIA